MHNLFWCLLNIHNYEVFHYIHNNEYIKQSLTCIKCGAVSKINITWADKLFARLLPGKEE